MDRYRPRWHVDLRHLLLLPSGMAHLDQPLCRGHDAVCCACLFPLHVGRPWLAWLLPYPTPWGCGRSSAVRSCGTYLRCHLCHSVVPVLVCRAHPRPGDPARPHPAPPGAWRCGFLAMGWRVRRCTGMSLPDGLPAPGRVSHAAGRVNFSVVSLDFAASIVPGWHATVFPPFFFGRRHLCGFCHGDDPAIPIRPFITCKTSSPCGTCRTWHSLSWPPA